MHFILPLVAAWRATSSVSGLLGGHLTSPATPLMTLDDEARRVALRLPDQLPTECSDLGDPLGGGDRDAQMMEQARYRVKRRADAGDFDAVATSQQLPLISLLAQVGFGGIIFIGLGCSWLVRHEADAGTAWAIDALANSASWWPAPARLVFERPPGGPLVLLYAGANGLNAVRCLPMLFDRLLVSSAPNAGNWVAGNVTTVMSSLGDEKGEGHD